jgi:site-specific DNA recombinase
LPQSTGNASNNRQIQTKKAVVKMVSTGIYVRVSTEEQAKEGYSIRAQEEKLRSYAELKGWHIYSVYADEGISGKDIDGRKAVKQLIADVASGKVNNVLVYKIDRLTRSTKNLIELVEIFNENHCDFNSLVESIDTSNAVGRMFLKIVGIFAEFERENLAERVRLGMERKAREGYALCSYMPSLGYTRDKGNKIQEIEDEEAAIVRRVFDMYLQDDYSFTKIAKILNAEKIATKRGAKWHMGTIKLILNNVNYVGRVRYAINDASRYFEADGQHEPIIDEDTFIQAQNKLRNMKHVTRTKRPTSKVYFCGVLYCQLCGGKLSSRWQYKKGEYTEQDGQKIREVSYPGYQCTSANKGGDCTAKSMSHIKLERAFEQYISQYDNLSADDIQPDKPLDNSAEVEIITAEIKQIEKKTEEIMSLFVSNTIDFYTYQGMVRLSNERRGELETRLTMLENAQKAKDAGFTVSDIIANFREHWAVMDNGQRQQFVQKFVKKLVVHSEVQSNGFLGNVVIDDLLFNEF